MNNFTHSFGRKQRNSQGEKQLQTDFWKIYFETEKVARSVDDNTDRCSRHKHPRALSKQWHLIGRIDFEVNYSLIAGIITGKNENALSVSHAILNGEKCAFLRNLRAKFEIAFAVILCKVCFNEYNWSGKLVCFYLIGQVEVDNLIYENCWPNNFHILYKSFTLSSILIITRPGRDLITFLREFPKKFPWESYNFTW